jgi:hypothetical protein
MISAGDPGILMISLKRRKQNCLGYFVYLFQNQEVNDHTGNLIPIWLKHEWRRKEADNFIIGALLERMSQVASVTVEHRTHSRSIWVKLNKQGKTDMENRL